MSFSKLTKISLSRNTLSPVSLTTIYTRPSDQITNTAIDSTAQAFQGVYAVYTNGPNHCALAFTTSTGQYQVDQGDGNVNSYNSGVQAEHIYTYSTVTGRGNPVCSRGYTTVLIKVTPVSGNLTGMDLQKIHSALSSSSSFNSSQLDLQLNAAYLTSINSPQYASVYFSLAEIFNINKNIITNFNNLCTYWNNLRVFSLGQSSCLSASAMFEGCSNLIAVPLFDTKDCTDCSYMFTSCYNLTDLPFFDLSKCTTLALTFQYCYNLKSIPPFNLSSCTSLYGTFYACKSLTSIPLFNTSNVTNWYSTFGQCVSLKAVPLFDMHNCTNGQGTFEYSGIETVPAFNLSNCTDGGSMFEGCYKITSVPLLNLSSCTSTVSMFAQCANLETVPAFNLSNVSTAATMFQGCNKLKSVPSLNLSSCSNADQMFQSCSSLQSIGTLTTTSTLGSTSSMFEQCSSLLDITLFTTSGVTNTTSMFSGCSSILSIPAFNLSSVQAADSMFDQCESLVSISCAPPVNFSLYSANLSSTALNALYTILPTVSGQTIDVTGNPGTVADTPSTATGKGWTVTG